MEYVCTLRNAMLKEDKKKKIRDFYWTMQLSDMFLVKINVSDCVERNFFSLTVLGRNVSAGDVHSSLTMDRHVQP